MVARRLPSFGDRIRPLADEPISIIVDGAVVQGVRGQTIAGVLLGSGTLAWRTTSSNQRPRGVFCGIGVCFDCVIVVNDLRDVRACLRRASEGDIVTTQYDALPTKEVKHD
ncbi:(2Fe-2S)-binding protein [Cryobacterium sp. Hh7]|uniref:(2Fe-2S)-binding protein n=1 Tax=Cryobacterium sp. Hh7 TaxID=1259159 RepID=UPI00106B2DB6|nr:(2Fe-2S)-binding protein [Cryobacterium sp. Hh7]TFD55856.1 (2Fe-2S)-binding protein [Cryobacterium sp. Hh7]